MPTTYFFTRTAEKMAFKRVVAPSVLLLLIPLTVADSQIRTDKKGYLYEAKFVQAAPGRLLELIDIYRARSEALKQAGEEPPLWIRHSQGDRWDLMLLAPLGSYSHHFTAVRTEKRDRIAERFKNRLRECTSWREDLFVYGPPVEELRAAFFKASFFHLEIFQALAGKQDELLREREMENAYSRALRRPENFIFMGDQGASWDLFTLGCYRDLKHYAESADIPEKDQEAAAKAAGFDGPNRIGPYLRSLISQHHDTLAVAVK